LAGRQHDGRGRCGVPVDVDNTLLDNDLRAHLASEFGSESRDRYWEIFEALRVELGCADYLGALQRYPARHYAMVDDKLRNPAVMK
jgi:hypothetical protein